MELFLDFIQVLLIGLGILIFIFGFYKFLEWISCWGDRGDKSEHQPYTPLPEPPVETTKPTFQRSVVLKALNDYTTYTSRSEIGHVLAKELTDRELADAVEQLVGATLCSEQDFLLGELLSRFEQKAGIDQR